MGIPSAVQKQGDAAIKLQADVIAEGTPVIIDDTAPVVESDQEVVKPIAEVKPKNYEQSYKVLKGKYDRETETLRRELGEIKTLLSQANATNNNLNDIIVRLNSQPAPVKTGEEGEQKPATQGKKTLKPEDYEGYGEEMLDMVNTINALSEENEKLKSAQGQTDTKVKTVEQVVETVGSSIKKDANTRFFDDLTREVKNWREINGDDEWKNWLAQEDPGTGQRRQDLLIDAQTKANVNRVAYWFKSFINETGRKPATGSRRKGPSLEEEIIPEGGGGGGAMGSGESTIVTRKQFAQASKDYVDKKITKEKYDKITRDFQQSIKEGKV